MENSYISKVRTICRELDKIEAQITHLKSLNENNYNQLIEYESALAEKISELLMIRGEE